ncbi:MAG: AMP-binding protein [Kiritimatiellae bacterium]|nr:AMP-binding protein [Kiritimatiellia bacterium]
MNDVRCPLSDSAMISHDRIAILGAEGILHYGDFEQCVRTTALLLERAGCRAGDRVAILLPLSWRYLVLVMALFRVGAVACLVNPRWPRKRTNARLEQIACRKIIAAGAAPRDGGVEVLQAEDLVGFVAPNRDKEAAPPRLRLDQPATIFFATRRGRAARAVLHSFGNHYYSARGSNVNLRVGSGDRWLLSLPIHEVGGLGIFLRCVMSGATVVLPVPGKSLEHTIREYEVTHVSLTPAQLGRFLGRPGVEKLAHLRAVLLVGGSLPSPLLKKAEARGLSVYGSYALPEMASQVATMDPASPPGERLTSGKPLKYREVRLAGDGQVMVRGATLFSGYVEGDRLVLPLDADGWFATGDYGRMDGNGYLTITGRARVRRPLEGEALPSRGQKRRRRATGSPSRAASVRRPS